MMHKIILIFVISTLWYKASCQSDTLLLPEIEVIEPPSFTNVPGQAKRIFTELEGLQSKSVGLGEILNMQSNVFVKSYGSSGISTLSVRGSGASHTGIVWNGFDIQNIQNGQFDFSSIRIAETDRISIIYGGTGAQTGSGSIGGTVFIDNELNFGNRQQAEVQTLFGSFQHFSQFAKIEDNREKISYNFSLLNLKAKNNFTYKNTAQFGYPVDTIKNGASDNQSITSNAKIKTGKNSTLNIHLWGEKSHSETPGTMIIPHSCHYIDNQNLRSGLYWQLSKKRMKFDIRSGYFFGKMDYYGVVTSNHLTNNQINEFSLSGILSEWKYKVSSNIAFEWLESNDLTENPNRQKTSFFGLLQREWSRVEAVIISRQEFIDGKNIPFTPAAGINLFDKQKISLSAFVSRSYRLPTFNDLYWTGWGNRNLKPEDAINTEFSIKYKTSNKLISTFNRLGTFYNDINKMIVWLPVEGTSIWRPENINKIYSYGVEFENSTKLILSQKLKFSNTTNYTFVKSISHGKQSIYVPEHKGGLLLAIDYRKFRISYNHIFTGKRFANAENTVVVDAYSIANLRVGFVQDFKNIEANISAGVNNMYNSVYQVVRFYPTPPRNFDIAISLKFSKNIKQTIKQVIYH